MKQVCVGCLSLCDPNAVGTDKELPLPFSNPQDGRKLPILLVFFMKKIHDSEG